MSTELVPVPSTDVTLLFDSSILAGQLAPSSISMYARDFRAYLAYARTPAAALDPATLARWRALLAADTSLSPNTINRMLSAVKRLIKEAAVQGYVAHETAKAFGDIGVTPSFREICTLREPIDCRVPSTLLALLQQRPVAMVC